VRSVRLSSVCREATVGLMWHFLHSINTLSFLSICFLFPRLVLPIFGLFLHNFDLILTLALSLFYPTTFAMTDGDCVGNKDPEGMLGYVS